MSEDNNTTFTLRVPKDLKKAFEIATKANDLTSAQVLRQMMRHYVENHMKHTAQGDLLKTKGDKK